MIDDKEERVRHQRNLITDQASYLLGDSLEVEGTLGEVRKTVSHARNAAFSLNGFERNFFFENQGDVHRDLGAVSGLDSNIDARSFATADMDGDGDLDVVVKNLQSRLVQFFRNDIPSDHHRVFFRLEGTNSNRDAIGARVEIRHGATGFQMAEIRSASGFQSQSPRDLFFGLGDDAVLEQVDVFWPSGATQTFRDLESGFVYDIGEEAGIIGRRPLEARGTAQVEGELPVDPRKASVFVDRRKAPAFDVEDVSGAKISGGDLYAQGPLLVSFMTTWTSSFEDDVAALAELKQRHPGLEVLVFFVDLVGASEDPAAAGKALDAGLQVARCNTRFVERFSGQPNVVFPCTFAVVESEIVLDAMTRLQGEALERLSKSPSEW